MALVGFARSARLYVYIVEEAIVMISAYRTSQVDRYLKG
jgi:hypothetical protein